MSTENRRVRAPFTPEQVESLNAYQRSGRFHEFTCACGHIALIARPEGWICPNYCGYTQDWAWSWMADGSWNLNSSPSQI